MNTETNSGAATSETRLRQPRDPVASLRALQERGATVVRYFREAAAIAGEGLSASRVRIETSTHGQDVTEDWVGDSQSDVLADLVEAVLLELSMEGQTVARVVQNEGAPHLLLGLRISSDPDAPTAFFGAAVPCRSQAEAQDIFERATALAESIGTHAPTPKRLENQGPKPEEVDAGVARAAAYENPTQFAFKMVNSLRPRLGADQVCFGVVRGRRCKIIAISGQDDVQPKNAELRVVRQAMDECVDHGKSLVAQDDDRWNEGSLSSGHRLHAQWRSACAGSSVASLPLLDGDRVVAVISIRRPGAKPFSREEIDSTASQVAPFGASMRLLRRASRNLIVHAIQSSYRSLAWAGSPQGLKTKFLVLLFAAAAAFVAFGSLPHVVTTPATVLAQETRHMGAPIEGRLVEVRVRPGDRVAAGALIARFDTSELVLQQRELRAEAAALEIEIDRAAGSSELAEAQVLRARRNVVERKLEGVEARIDRATVRAPYDGLVIAGDLRDRRGDVFSLGETLVEVARGDSLRIEVQLDERDWRHVHEQNKGEFAPHSHPEHGHEFRLHRIRAAAETIEGQNRFVADAHFLSQSMEEAEIDLRPGMSGVARLEIGERPVWWLASHRAIDWLRMKMWF